MGMLTKEDINQIGEMMDVRMDAKFVKFEERVVGRVVEEVGEMIEQNLFPKFDDVDKRFDKIERRLTSVESSMVTKEYLDDKIADLKDVFVMKKKPGPGFLLPQS